MINFSLVFFVPGVGVDAATGFMNFFIYFLAYFIIAFVAYFSNFLNFRTRGSKNVDAIRNESLKKTQLLDIEIY